MSHRIERGKQDDRQSNFNSTQAERDLPKPEELSQPVSCLSDADYEFLFDQLLEGITHGWQDRRIAKFFARLGDRGKQSDWVAWLERLQKKVVTLPNQSQRQLATMMIRFGDLTQVIPEIKPIGAASRRIGRELLFSNAEDEIWEYVGPDVPKIITPIEQPSEELALNSAPPATIEPELASAKSAIEEATQTLAVTTPTSLDSASSDNTEKNPPNEKVIVQEDNLSSKSSKKITISFNSDSTSNEINTRYKLLGTKPSQSLAKQENGASAPQETEITPIGEESDISEGTLNTAGVAETSDSNSSAIKKAERSLGEFSTEANETESDLSLSTAEELPNIEFTANDTSAIIQPSEQAPVAVDMQRVMNLIQEDKELAQQILQKLNVSSVQSDLSINSINTSQSPVIASDLLESSDVELIESWFNLGLKQVGTGKYEAAIASWEKALEINPHLSEAWHNRGSALGRLGKYEEAVTSFQNALNIDPNNCQAWNDCAHALYQLQNWTEAVNSWNNAIKIMPGNHLFWYNRGCALEQLADWNRAIASYEKSLEIKPDFSPGRSRYINLVADNSRSN